MEVLPPIITLSVIGIIAAIVFGENGYLKALDIISDVFFSI